MSRLPVPGSDNNTWGDILNDFLLVEHRADGTLKKVNYFSAAGKITVSDADFAAAPPDGSVATVHNSTDDTTRFFTRSNSAWDEISGTGPTGPQGPPGQGVPTGGTTSQVLSKQSNTDYDTIWVDDYNLPVGGNAGQVLAKNTGTNYDVIWIDDHNLPIGGTTGQVLSKQSNTNYDAVWVDPGTFTGVTSFAKNGSVQLTGDVTLSEGTNVTLTQVGQDIQISSIGGGSGLPTGGTSGQVLEKQTNTDFDVIWVDDHNVPAGGTTGQALVKTTNTDYDIEWTDPATFAGVTSLSKNGDTQLTGDITLSEGDGVALTESGQDIAIAQKVGVWHYVTPVAPAPDPPDLILGDPDAVSFQNSWGNAQLPNSTYAPFAYRIHPVDNLQFIGSITGGTVPSVVITLPVGYRPTVSVIDVMSSADGTEAMTIQIDPSGDVTILDVIANTGGGGGSGGITSITSNDNSVTITNPTGPVVDLSVPVGGGSGFLWEDVGI